MRKITFISSIALALLASCGVKTESTLENGVYRGQIMEDDGNVASYETTQDDMSHLSYY